MAGLFGRHAADAMRWSGGCRGCWSPPGHRPGWCHLQKWSSTGTLRVLNDPKGCIAQARIGKSDRPSEPSFPEDVARQAASFAFGRLIIGELAVYHAVADGRKVGGSRKAHSVSTWPAIPDRSLRVGDLVDTGWGLQLDGEQAPLWTLVGVRQHGPSTGDKQEQPGSWSCLASRPSCEGVATLAQAADQYGKLCSWLKPNMFDARNAS